MRLIWGLVAALGLLIGAGLAGGQIAPLEQVTRPVAPHETVLIGGTTQPAPAVEPAPSTATRLPPAAPARRAPTVNLPRPVVPPPAAAVSSAAEESRPGAARDGLPVAAVTGARPEVARPAATAAGGTQRDVARPTAEPLKPGVPRVSAATPTPCVLEPPPRHLDAAAPAPEK